MIVLIWMMRCSIEVRYGRVCRSCMMPGSSSRRQWARRTWRAFSCRWSRRSSTIRSGVCPRRQSLAGGAHRRRRAWTRSSAARCSHVWSTSARLSRSSCTCPLASRSFSPPFTSRTPGTLISRSRSLRSTCWAFWVRPVLYKQSEGVYSYSVQSYSVLKLLNCTSKWYIILYIDWYTRTYRYV